MTFFKKFMLVNQVLCPNKLERLLLNGVSIIICYFVFRMYSDFFDSQLTSFVIVIIGILTIRICQTIAADRKNAFDKVLK